MNLLDRFKRNRKSSAQIAKERLQIIVAHESTRRLLGTKGAVDLQELKIRLVHVIADYLHINEQQVEQLIKVELNTERSILELDITLPDRV